MKVHAPSPSRISYLAISSRPVTIDKATLGPYRLPPLRFAYDAFEPVIDEATMRLHHDAHHQAYVDGVNAALARYPEWLGLTIEEVLSRLEQIPCDIRQAARDQGGGHANHQFFWKVLLPNGPGKPSGELAAAIDRDFGSYDAFKVKFQEAGVRHFGSGWVFLVAKPRQDSKLEILSLPNQDSLLEQAEPSPGLLCCDLWEHAHYLRYNNRRADWLAAWWGIVHWEYVSERLAGIKAGRKQL